VRLGESALEFELLVWTADPMTQFRLISDLNCRIASALPAYGVQIPFPQRDLHLRSPSLERALAAWTRRNLPEAAADEAPVPVSPSTGVEHLADDLAELGPEAWSDAELALVVEKMRGPMGIPVADRRYLLNVYRDCFVGSEAVDWLADHAGLTRSEAVTLGERLVEMGRIRHVLAEQGFRDGYYFYRFHEDAAVALGTLAER
jgi:hypothetical protein